MMPHDPQLRMVKPENPCDVCGVLSQYYHTGWFIHICSFECYQEFLQRYQYEIDVICIKKLNGDSLNVV
jgi:hypothetical protein